MYTSFSCSLRFSWLVTHHTLLFLSCRTHLPFHMHARCQHSRGITLPWRRQIARQSSFVSSWNSGNSNFEKSFMKRCKLLVWTYGLHVQTFKQNIQNRPTTKNNKTKQNCRLCSHLSTTQQRAFSSWPSWRISPFRGPSWHCSSSPCAAYESSCSRPYR